MRRISGVLFSASSLRGRFIRIAATILLTTASAPAQEVNYRGLYYTLPPGWISGEQDGQFILAPSDMTDETAVVSVLYGAEKLAGKSFQQWLKERMASGVGPQATVLQDSAVQSGSSGGIQTLSTGRTVQDSSGGVRLQIYHALSDGTLAAGAMVITSSEKAVSKYMPAIQALFGSMNFGKQVPAPGAAQEKSGTTAAPAPQPSAAGTRTFHNVIYTPPPGWAVRENSAGAVVSPQGQLQGEESLDVVILPGKTGSDLEQEFRTTWNEVCGMLNAQSMRTVNGAMYDTEGVQRSWNGWDYMRGEGGAFNDQIRYTLGLFLVKVNGRIERVAIVSREMQVNLMVATASHNPRFENAINDFLFGLRFANFQAPGFPEARLTGGPITGVWGGISMFGGQLKTGAAVFFSDGSAWFGSGFPTRGLADSKPHIQSGSDLRRWGKYKFEGTTGVLAMPYGEIPLRLEPTGLVLVTNNTPHKFIRSHMPAIASLNGRYCFEDGSECIAFTPGGRFQDQGVGRVIEHSAYPYPLSPERGEGTYEIRDYTLILRYAGKVELRVGFPGYFDRSEAQNPNPGEIVLSFNLDKLKKRM